jgi:adenylosuccinate synthase
VRRKRRATWFEVMLRRGGMRHAQRAMTFAMCWLMVQQDLGHEPTVEEYSVWWKQSSRTTYRDLESWRSCMPEFSTPTGWYAVAGTRDLMAKVPADFVLEGG